jgi:hypothetical protein
MIERRPWQSRTEDLGCGWLLTVWPKRRGRSWTEYEISQLDADGYIVRTPAGPMHGRFCRRRDAMSFMGAHRKEVLS